MFFASPPDGTRCGPAGPLGGTWRAADDVSLTGEHPFPLRCHVATSVTEAVKLYAAWAAHARIGDWHGQGGDIGRHGQGW